MADRLCGGQTDTNSGEKDRRPRKASCELKLKVSTNPCTVALVKLAEGPVVTAQLTNLGDE